MTTQEIAARLVELCRQGDFDTAQKELFATDAASLEQHATPAFEKETKGLDAIREKGKKWQDMVSEVRGITVSDPLVAGNSFACTMRMDVTMKEGGDMGTTELCVYTVKDGKVATEEFFM
jgi:ketosteroid isomerase-like protein